MTEATQETETKELALVAQQNGLEKGKIAALLSEFGEPYVSALNVINQAQDINVTSEEQKDEIEQASIARKELKKIRCDVENTRKDLKEASLREGRAIDGMANIIKAIIVPEEERLEKQEKIVERLAAERFAKQVQERKTRLLEYTDQPTMYKFETVSDSEFEALIASLKEAQEVKLAAERKAEAERLAAEKAAAIEQEQVRKENEKLRAEALAREAQIAKEREAEQTRLAAERAEQEKRLAAERQKREALEAEQRAKAEAEAKAKAEAEEAQRQSLLAPGKDKLNKFADVIDAIELPHVANREAGQVLDETKDYLNRISKNLRQKAGQL